MNLRTAMDRRLSCLKADESQLQQVHAAIKGDREPMKRNSISLAMALAIIALVSVAVAAALSPTIGRIKRDLGESAGTVPE